ncbi:MAG TPA: DUF1326 domain-containing protein [Actinomycetota bacterium]|nr:DUF1326 domain-containing protein [Actinomycetota bacterium]
MAWSLAADYVLHCPCNLVCPCTFDAQPTAPGGECRVTMVCRVERGSFDGLDLSGVRFALVFAFRSNPLSGEWKGGIVVDEAATEEQARALEHILTGEAGGPFADFAPLVGEFLGVQRAAISFEDGESPRARVGDRVEIGFEAFRGEDGAVTTVRNALLAWGPEFAIGRGSGSGGLFGLDYEPVYGEAGRFEVSGG